MKEIHKHNMCTVYRFALHKDRQHELNIELFNSIVNKYSIHNKDRKDKSTILILFGEPADYRLMPLKSIRMLERIFNIKTCEYCLSYDGIGVLLVDE